MTAAKLTAFVLIMLSAGCGSLKAPRPTYPPGVSEDGVFSSALAHYAQGILLQTDEGLGSTAARDAYRHAHRLDPHSAPPLVLTILSLLEAGLPDEALALMKAQSRLQPGSAETWATLGRVAETAGDHRCAAQAFARVRTLHRDAANDTDTALAEIRNRFKAGDDRTAVRLLRRFATTANLPPDVAHTPLLWARHFIIEDKTPQRALPVIQIIADTAATPEEKAATLTFYGDALLRTGATNRAIRAYWQALEHEPVHMPAAQRIGTELHRRSDSNAVNRLAARIPAGRRPLATALAASVAFTLFKRPEEAANALLVGRDAALRRTGARPPETYYLALGAALDELEQDGRAAAIFTEALSVHTNAHVVMNHLAYMWAVNNERIDEAMVWAERALTHQPRNYAYIDTLGWIYYRQGRLHDALTQLLLAARLAPKEDGVIFDHIGDVLRDLGRTEEAVAFWRQALVVSPEIPGLVEKLEAFR